MTRGSVRQKLLSIHQSLGNVPSAKSKNGADTLDHILTKYQVRQCQLTF